jgi:alpha-glucosidase
VPEEPALDYWKNLPTTWDETRVLAGDIGRRAVVARRKGEQWFVGAIAPADGQFQIPLGFLAAGKKYTAQIYSDPAHGTGVQIEERAVDAQSIMAADIPANGGMAVRLFPSAP